MLISPPPLELWLEITESLQQQAWEESQNYPHATDNWRAYLNRIALDTLLTYLVEEYHLTATAWPNRKDLPSFWGVVEGTMIQLGTTKILLLPTETIDLEELRVPQEWVDIPGWIPDYYLGLAINLDEQMMGVGGYISHRQLKNEGNYEPTDRTYSIARDKLVSDFNVLLVSQQLGLQESTQTTLAPLSNLTAVQAENLLKRLGKPENLIPRLMVPFSFWGALLENSSYRQQLYQLRQGQAARINPLTHLSNWLENIFTSNWQPLEDLNLAFSARRSSTAEEIQRAKIIALGPDLPEVILLISIKPEIDDRVGVSIQLYPTINNHYLPEQIELSLYSEDQELLQSVQARSEDNYLRIQRFKANKGLQITVQIALGECSQREDFVV